jgi:hypothetical protein
LLQRSFLPLSSSFTVKSEPQASHTSCIGINRPLYETTLIHMQTKHVSQTHLILECNERYGLNFNIRATYSNYVI